MQGDSVKREEGFRTLYSGLGPNVLRVISVNLLWPGSTEFIIIIIILNIYANSCKGRSSFIIQLLQIAGKPASKLTQSGAASVGAFMGSFLLLPLEILKSRLKTYLASMIALLIQPARISLFVE